MKKFITLLLFIFLFPFTSNVLAEEIKLNSTISTKELFDPSKEYQSQELIIKFKAGITEKERVHLLTASNLTEQSFYNGLSLVKVYSQEPLKKVVDKLLTDARIEFAEPNYEIKASYLPKDSSYHKQWYLNTVNSEKAWDETKGSSKITVAVIDGGMQTDHPEFKGRIVSPYNAVTNNHSINPDIHGTHVAGIIAAANDKKGTIGIAPNVHIMPINIFTGDGADAYDESVGIMYAVDHGANIINMSYNSLQYSYAEEHAIKYAASKGVVLVAAAGNDGNNAQNYPAAYDSVIAVTATDDKDQLTNFSNYGASVDISAPGNTIYSTSPTNSYKTMSGTSMAAPVVSGVAALVLSKNPLLSLEDVTNILITSTKDLGAAGRDEQFGYGRIDAEKALTNTPAPLSELIVSGKKKNNVSISIYKGCNVSLTVENEQRKTIKTITSIKKWNGGTLSATWDGTDNQNHLVSNGKYKFVVKAKNGKEVIAKSKIINFINESTPNIKMKSSAPVHFSPVQKKKGTFSFQLTKNAKVNAKIIDNKGKYVKTILSKKPLTAGNYSFSWDGTSSKKKRVKDGNYQLVLTIAESKKKPTSTKMVVDTKAPAVKEQLSSSTLQMNGQTNINSTLELSEDAKVTAFIQTDKGQKIKKLVNNIAVKTTKTTFNWNGKNDQQAFVQEGNYNYFYEIKDKAGNIIKKNSAAFFVQDWQKPSLEVNNVVYDKTTADVSIPYTASKHGGLRVEIFKENISIKTLEIETTVGNQIITWDGKDNNGNTLEDGNYEIRMTLTDAYQQSILKTATLTVGATP
ncbi:S8 family serine peptidase [Niallia sp. 01092]|uniref:S8 family serine peptidase n=1 Tax=unclassified Niallia TaxID=2837522 RepID=UPI003FD163B8